MPYEEKMTWVSGIVAVVVPAVYFVIIGGQLGETPAADIDYQRTLLIAVGISIVASIVGAIVAAVGTAVRAELTGEGSVDDIDRKDERDVSISRRGELVGQYVTSVGAVGALALAMLEFDHFWIANALYMSFVIGTFVGAVVKIASYRRGF